MYFFDLFKGPDIDQGVEEYKHVSGAILLDVRTPDEYREGHIPSSQNIPLQTIEKVKSAIKDPATPLFVYCYSGSRSAQATAVLKRMGYTHVKNIGGIAGYTGRVAV